MSKPSPLETLKSAAEYIKGSFEETVPNTADEENAVATLDVPSDAWKTCIGKLHHEGEMELTPEIVEAVRTYDKRLSAAHTLATGMRGIELCQEHNHLNRVTSSMPNAGNRSGVVFDRKASGTVRGQAWERWGATTVTTTTSGSGKSGDLGRVRAHITEEAGKILAD